jgi:hypothetical protein
MSKVLNKKQHGIPPGAVYIGRGDPRRGVLRSKWHNPFRIGKDGDRVDVILRYAAHLRTRDDLLQALDELRGKDLVCHCAPEPCHGDLLLWLANATPNDRIAWQRAAD